MKNKKTHRPMTELEFQLLKMLLGKKKATPASVARDQNRSLNTLNRVNEAKDYKDYQKIVHEAVVGCKPKEKATPLFPTKKEETLPPQEEKTLKQLLEDLNKNILILVKAVYVNTAIGKKIVVIPDIHTHSTETTQPSNGNGGPVDPTKPKTEGTA